METENPQKEFLFYCWKGNRFAKEWPSFMAAQKTAWNPKQIWRFERIPGGSQPSPALRNASVLLPCSRPPGRQPSLQVQCPSRPPPLPQQLADSLPTDSSPPPAVAMAEVGMVPGQGAVVGEDSHHPAARSSTEFLQLPQVMPLPFSTRSLGRPWHAPASGRLRRSGFAAHNEAVTSIRVSFWGLW